MLAMNIGSVMMLPIFAIYSLTVVEPVASLRDVPKRLMRLTLWGSVGAVACIVGYGLVSLTVLHGPFMFWLDQVRFAKLIEPSLYSAALGEVARNGHWLTIHAAALLASIAALVVQRRRNAPQLSPFARFCFVTIAAVYPLFIAGEALHRSFFLGRSGLYSSHWLFVTYLAVAALAFGAKPPRWVVWLSLALFPSVAIAKLAMHDGLGLTTLLPHPMIAVAALMAIALVIAFAGKRAIVRGGALVALAALTLLVPWHFDRDDSLLEARDYILTGGVPPRVFYSEADAQRVAFVSITAALTDHVLHDHYDGFPRPIARGDRIAVLATRFASDSGGESSPCVIPGLRPVGSKQLTHRYYDIEIHLFEALEGVRTQDVHCRLPSDPDPRFAPILELGTAELAGDIGERSGETLTATEGRSAVGLLTRGSGLHLSSGVYNVTYEFATADRRGDTHRWAITGVDGSGEHVIGGGELPDTAGQRRTISAPFRLTHSIDDIELRTEFSGTGTLSVFAIRIERLRNE
jgi:hypothetical protein